MSLVEMQISDVRWRRMDGTEEVRHIVILQEVQGPRWMLLWIGVTEALAMTMLLEQFASPRPLTYALTADLVRAAGGQVQEVRIDRLERDVFDATVVLTGSGGEHTIDARPSDALNVALTVGAPVRVAEDVLAALQAEDPLADLALLQTETEGRSAIMASIAA